MTGKPTPGTAGTWKALRAERRQSAQLQRRRRPREEDGWKCRNGILCQRQPDPDAEDHRGKPRGYHLVLLRQRRETRGPVQKRRIHVLPV